MRLWHFSSSLKSFFKGGCAAIQWGVMSEFWSDPLSTSILHVCEQRRQFLPRWCPVLQLAWTSKLYCCKKWAPSSEFVSSNIPSWQILTAHAQPSRGARDLAFCLKVPLDSLLVWASNEGSGETARMRRLAWTFAARIGDKYQIRLTRSISWLWPATVCSIFTAIEAKYSHLDTSILFYNN